MRFTWGLLLLHRSNILRLCSLDMVLLNDFWFNHMHTAFALLSHAITTLKLFETEGAVNDTFFGFTQPMTNKRFFHPLHPVLEWQLTLRQSVSDKTIENGRSRGSLAVCKIGQVK